MNDKATVHWNEANQRYLMAAFAAVRDVLERHARSRDASEAEQQACALQQELRAAAQAMPAPPALEKLCAAFGLSPFEREVALLCAGMELDSAFASLCAAAQGEPNRPYPTFSLALAALHEPHWSALTPPAPLRRGRLIEIAAGSALTTSPLRIDECVLHYLAGAQHLDERLVGLIEPLRRSGDLVRSHLAVAKQLAATWSQVAGTETLPVVQLCGDEPSGKRAIAIAACTALGLNLSVLSANLLPLAPSELESLIRLWEREAALSTSALLLDCDQLDSTDAARESAIARLIEQTGGALIVTGRERRRLRQRPMFTFEVRKPSTAEQRSIWESVLGIKASNVNGQIEALVSQFSLSTSTIHAACAEALERTRIAEEGSETEESGPLSASPDPELPPMLWEACRIQARPRLEDLAQRIESALSWDDLVLPEPQREILRHIAAHVRQRAKVYEIWGFARRGIRGLGISALFAGASGTGKTMAAEVLANDLKLDLYRIDLSQVVSKYIGETEKNLRRVFDAAEEGGAILLFDEADALFGKRSEVKDSHDRYANIEISYLLQRMDAYRGLAILTTNFKSALDPAFMRRLRFIVNFPFPGVKERKLIWENVFPKADDSRGLMGTPVEALNYDQLAKLNLTGGSIHNIALNAAFLAAQAGSKVAMPFVLEATRTEFRKLERPLNETDFRLIQRVEAEA